MFFTYISFLTSNLAGKFAICAVEDIIQRHIGVKNKLLKVLLFI